MRNSVCNFYVLFAPDESGQALMQMGNPKDCEKKIKAKPIAPLVWPGQRTGRLRYFVRGLNYRSDRTKLLLRVIRDSWRRCLFRFQTSQL